jgi:Kef-type K+ transport system membrane component KefB
MNAYTVAAVWMALALLASLVSIRAGIAVALAEIAVGVIAGNLPFVSQFVQQTPFTTFLATTGSVMLTFLAGAEIDPVSLRRHWKASVSIGVVSFALPFAVALAVCLFLLHWSLQAAEIGGVALSTTSVAVVYAVMVETGLNRQELGKLILAACFVTDLGTVLALGVLFAGFSPLLLVFALVTVAALVLVGPTLRYLMRTLGHRVSEPEIKFLLVVLFGLGGLASAAGSEAVLPAYVLGLAIAGVCVSDRVLIDRMRAIAFALLTPFFFLRAGLLISVPALSGGIGLVVLLLATKVVSKLVGVWPVAALFHVERSDRNYLTLLMATGLTFGSISALYGLTKGLIDQGQYSVLLTVVILSAVLPTLVAQRLFRPRTVDVEEEEALGAEDASIVHRG